MPYSERQPATTIQPIEKPLDLPTPFTTEDTPAIEHEPTYPTGFGNLTFSELYSATDRIVGYTLREKLGMTNPEDVDDCMQAGYFKVWQQLQKRPDLFVDKPKKYVVEAVVMRSKAQRYAHLRHYRKLDFDAPPTTGSNDFLTSAQIDTWIDLERAIETVGNFVVTLDNPIHLLGLYTLLTEAKTRDVAGTFGYGMSTLNSARQRVRATVARELPEYGKHADQITPLTIPARKRIRPYRRSKELLSTRLLTDPPLTGTDSFEMESQAVAPPEDIREVVSPEIPEPTYPTRWRGAVTLEEDKLIRQFMVDCALRSE